jgi:predicted extracellular nuclease
MSRRGISNVACTLLSIVVALHLAGGSAGAQGITGIHAIQGSGSAVIPGTYTVEAIVVGAYQTVGPGQLRGFFIQEEDGDADADPATSEGLFVFCSSCPVPVSVGDKVRVTGEASEFFGMSQLTATTAGSVEVLGSGNPLPTPATVVLPVPGVPAGDLAAATAAINAYFEAFEGMLVTFPDTLTVAEYFELARYGQVVLTSGGRPRQFTDANLPSAGGLIDHQIDLARRTIILDDTDNRQNRPVDTPNTPYFHPVPGLSTGNLFRGGDTITDLTGVLHWSFAGQAGTDAWRIRPVTEAFGYAFTPANPRPAVPPVGGRLAVAGVNAANYFLTLDTTSGGAGPCGPSFALECRGADSAQELARQREKLLAALQGLDADVLGLIEIENTPGVEPLADIAAGLPGYAYIDTGAIGADAIRVGIIYRAGTVQPVGSHAILDSSVDPRFDDTRNRPALAQTFEEVVSGARFTVVVNNLKSRGSSCGPGDDDTTTGQGNCNGTRTQAALALADWLATDPTGSDDPDVVIIGDLNAYAKEDPIAVLEDAGYTNLVGAFGGPGAYTFLFDGQLGYLDHALSSPSLTAQISGAAAWHINADEVPLFDYNDDVLDPGEASFEEESDTLPLYAPDAFRISDHDPVIVGLGLAGPAEGPGVVTRFGGSASGIGRGAGKAAVKIVGRFESSIRFDCSDLATAAVEAVIQDGSGDLISPPVSLRLDERIGTTTCIFTENPLVDPAPPSVRLLVSEVATGAVNVYNFRLQVSQGTRPAIGSPPCPAAPLRMAFSVDDGPDVLHVEATVEWTCSGTGNRYLKAPYRDL